MLLVGWFVCFYFTVFEVLGLKHDSTITIMNNGYSNILIAIHPDVPEDLSLLKSIQDMMVGASQYLYVATEKRAYFMDVTIVIPNTWSNNVSWTSATSELYNNADVVIKNSESHRKKRSLGNSPRKGSYTQNYGGCGIPGVRIHLFTDIFDVQGSDIYGPSIFVHEWAHFKWGVFDEFAQEGDQLMYFSPTTKMLEVVRCNLHLAGILSNTQSNGSDTHCQFQNSSTEDCVFHPYTDLNLNENITASIMDKVLVPSIKYFCNANDSDIGRVHNYEAPNRQNRLCGGKSSWMVIRESEDFKDGRNSPRHVENITPMIKYVRVDLRRRLIIAIDKSTSMKINDNFLKARQAVASFIEDMLVDETQVGIIAFSGSSNVIVPVIKITDDVSKQILLSKLPTECEGVTNIGAALIMSLKSLKIFDSKPSSSAIVVITDGLDTSGTTINNVTEELKNAGVVVSIISFSNEENKDLESLAKQTGGDYYIDSGSLMSISALEALRENYVALNSDQNDIPILILSEGYYLKISESLEGSFLVDVSLGNNTKIIVTYTTEEPPQIVIYSPTGRQYCSLYPEYHNDPILRRVKIIIPYVAESGRWTYKVTNGDVLKNKVYLIVMSSSKEPREETIKMTGSIIVQNDTWPIMTLIVAEVRGHRLFKNLRVKAKVSRPLADPVELELYDNGIGADINKNDGIYSRFFTSFTTSGRYSASIVMSDNEGNIMITGGLNEGSQITRAYAGSAYIEHWKLPSEKTGITVMDEFPPIRVTDLRVLYTSVKKGTVVLAWTAPGDDADQDKASYYTILMSHAAATLINEVDLPVLNSSYIVQGNLNSPQVYGMKEKVTLKMETYQHKNASFVFAVFAVDDCGNKGEMSNLVTVGFGYVPDVLTQEYLNDILLDEHFDAKAAPTDQKVVIACVVGFFATLLVLAIVITVIVHYINSRKAKREDRFSKEASSAIV